jgi:hypothetical protein
MATSAGAEGLDLKNIRQVHVMDPYWYESRIDQVIGRAIRRGSHDDLPDSERNVEVYRYLTVYPNHTKENKNRPKNSMATDEYINHNSKKKQKVIDQILLSTKEAAVDCSLYKKQIKEDYTCLDFGDQVRSDELAYHARRSKNVSHNVRETEVTYKKAFVNKKTREIYFYDSKAKKMLKQSNKTKKDVKAEVEKAKKDKKLIPVYVDFDNLSIFTFKSVKNDKPKQIGMVNTNGRFKKM